MRKIAKGRFGGIIILYIIFLLISFVTRVVLMISSFTGIDFSIWELLKLFLTGFFFDTITFAYIAIPFVIVNTFLTDKFRQTRFYRYATYFLFFILFYLMLFNAVAEYFFWEEFGVRYNFITVDYLIYTTEVIGNIEESYPMPAILSSLFIATVGLIIFIIRMQLLEQAFLSCSNWKGRFKKAGISFLFIIFSVLFVKQSYTETSKNRYHIELAKNGIYSFVVAFRNNQLDYHEFYLERDDNECVKRLRGLLKQDNVEFTGEENGIKRIVNAQGEEKRYNVMLITIESFSAGYLNYFGNNRRMMPYLDSLINHSIFFSNMYATGTRTVMGLEAITLSNPPTPGTSIVKRPSNANMFSFGFIFNKRGYDTKYIYGGYGYFDNMNKFFSVNGFSIVDRTNIPKENQTFANIWGVCDEDLFNQAIKEADQSFAGGKPFLNFIMTTSNHRPFTFPEGKIDFPSGTDRMGGTLYTDYAVNQFLNNSKNKPWFKNTIFIIIADHCGGSAGKTELPVKEYQVPLYIYNPNLFKPQVVDKLCSQLDLVPTLLGILNWRYESKFFGKDIFSMGLEDERAFISNYQKLGYIKKDQLLILSPMEKVSFYSFDRYSGNLKEIPLDTSSLEDAIAYFQSANYFFKNKLNRWED